MTFALKENCIVEEANTGSQRRICMVYLKTPLVDGKKKNACLINSFTQNTGLSSLKQNMPGKIVDV